MIANGSDNLRPTDGSKLDELAATASPARTIAIVSSGTIRVALKRYPLRGSGNR